MSVQPQRRRVGKMPDAVQEQAPLNILCIRQATIRGSQSVMVTAGILAIPSAVHAWQSVPLTGLLALALLPDHNYTGRNATVRSERGPASMDTRFACAPIKH